MANADELKRQNEMDNLNLLRQQVKEQAAMIERLQNEYNTLGSDYVDLLHNYTKLKQVLAAHDNEVIERCKEALQDCNTWEESMEAIQRLKQPETGIDNKQVEGE